MSSSSSSPEFDDALNRFLRVLLAEQKSDRLRSAEEYRAEFPELGEVIEEELQRLGSGAPIEGLASAALGLDLGAGRVLGDYRLIAELGRGGQGAVFLAEDLRLGRNVALKLLPEMSGWKPAVRQRFEREAQIAAALDHPGLCPVYEAGEHEGLPFVAMRHVEGRTLAQVLDEARQGGEAGLDPGRAAGLVAQAARALEVAHRAGFVHRDIKPGNLMVGGDDSVVVLDFGLAREFETDTSLTRTGELFGTPRYMAPEQIDDGVGAISPRTDVWGLGAVLYEALSGGPPFEEPVREALYRAILQREPGALGTVVRGLSRDYPTIAETALGKDPDRRYASAAHMADDLEAAAAGRPIRARRVGAFERGVLWARRSPRSAVLAAGLLLSALVATGLGGFLAAKTGTLRAGERELERLKLEEVVAQIYGGEISTDNREERRSSLDSWPQDVQLRAACALVDVRNKKYAEALELLDAAPPGTPEPRTLDRVRVLILRSTGRAGEADALEQSLGEPQSFEEFYTAAQIAEIETDPLDPTSFERPYQLAKSALFASPAPGAGLLATVSRYALASGDVETAEQIQTAMERRFPSVARVWFNGALIHSRANRNPQALAAFERCLELDPEFSQAYVSVAVLRAFEGDVAGGQRAYEEALAHDDEPQARLRLMLVWSRVMQRLGEAEIAVAEAERAVLLDPASAEADAVLEQARELLESAGEQGLDY